MKFEYLLEDLLNEASPQEIYQQYYSDIPEPTFQKIVSSDPQSVVNQGVIKRIGKYSKLFLKLFKEGSLKLEDLPKGKEYLSHVYKRNIPVNINNIKSLTDLYEIVKKYIVEGSPDLETVMSILNTNEYDYKLNGEKWMILIPKTEVAACYLGVGTQWCTTWGKNSLNKSYRDRENHFARHHKQGPLYILINKENPSDKYQFHFETKQYMNPADRQINLSEFLDNNPEVLKFFFPSLYNEDSISDEEMTRVNVLSDDTKNLLINKFIKNTDNILAKSIGINDLSKINELIVDDSLEDDVNIKDGRLVFNFKNTPYELNEYDSVLSYLHASKNNSYNDVWEDVNNMIQDNEWEDELQYIFEEYYKENVSDIKQMTEISNYEQFKNTYFENFYNNDKIQREYIDKYADLSNGNYDANINEMINDIEKFISVDRYHYRGTDIEIPIFRFIEYIAKNNITTISDVADTLKDYCYDNNVNDSYDGIYDYEKEPPTYEKLKYEIDKYFDDLFDIENENVVCQELRQKLNQIISQVFKGSDTFSNEHVYIKIPKRNIDCENQTVDIVYRNKNTGNSYNGAVKIDNLASYATNYKLFESYISFKKIIK